MIISITSFDMNIFATNTLTTQEELKRIQPEVKCGVLNLII